MPETNDYTTDEEPLLEIARAWAVVFPQFAEVVARIEVLRRELVEASLMRKVTADEDQNWHSHNQ